MQVEKYARVPFVVDAVQVTRANIHDVAEWCGGTVVPAEGDVAEHIKVKVYRPISDRQTQAFPGDWILWTDVVGWGFKVYTNKAFEKAFEPVFKEAGHLERKEPRIGVSSSQA